MTRAGKGGLGILAIGAALALAFAFWPDSTTTVVSTPAPRRTALAAATSVAVGTPDAPHGHVFHTGDGGTGPEPAPSPTRLRDPLAWAKMSRADFGCMIERETGYHDRLWNCATEEAPPSDPCADVENFFRGPQLPSDFAAKVGPNVERVEIHWEHGAAREVEIIFKPGVDERAIRDDYSIPATLKSDRDNVISMDLRDCGSGSRCLDIKGFERNDIDCGDGRRPD